MARPQGRRLRRVIDRRKSASAMLFAAEQTRHFRFEQIEVAKGIVGLRRGPDTRRCVRLVGGRAGFPEFLRALEAAASSLGAAPGRTPGWPRRRPPPTALRAARSPAPAASSAFSGRGRGRGSAEDAGRRSAGNWRRPRGNLLRQPSDGPPSGRAARGNDRRRHRRARTRGAGRGGGGELAGSARTSSGDCAPGAERRRRRRGLRFAWFGRGRAGRSRDAGVSVVAGALELAGTTAVAGGLGAAGSALAARPPFGPPGAGTETGAGALGAEGHAGAGAATFAGGASATTGAAARGVSVRRSGGAWREQRRSLAALARRRHRAIDLRFDQNVVRAADHDEMLDIIAPDEDQLSLAVEAERVDEAKPRLAVRPPGTRSR